MEECRKEGKEFNLHCTFCSKYVWPVFKHNTPIQLLFTPSSLIFCDLCKQIIKRYWEENQLSKEAQTFRVDRQLNGVRVIGGMFCIWCDKLFFNKGNDIMSKFIQIHIKLAHENEYANFFKNKCICLKRYALTFFLSQERSVLSDIEMFRNNYFHCKCSKCL